MDPSEMVAGCRMGVESYTITGFGIDKIVPVLN
jgi:hypothetical protein